MTVEQTEPTPRAVEPPGLREALRALGNGIVANRAPSGNIPAGRRVTGSLSRSLNDLSLTIAGIAAPLPVRATVRWSVHANNAAKTPLALGKDGAAILDGATTQLPSLLLEPDLVEKVKNQGALPITTRILRATITLTVELSSLGLEDISETFTPEVPIPQLALPLPRILVLHRNKGFAARSAAPVPAVGAALVLLPVGTALPFGPGNNGSEALWGADAFNALEADLLAPLVDAVGDLTKFTGFAGALLGLSAVRKALREIQTSVRVHIANAVDNFNDERFFTLIDRGIPVDVEADNEMSSLLLLAVPGRRARLYENKNRNPNDGLLEVTAGDFGVTVIENLHKDDPESIPPGKASTNPNAAGAKTFGDSISSFEFV